MSASGGASGSVGTGAGAGQLLHQSRVRGLVIAHVLVGVRVNE